ncbi:MAG: helix-turn-helix domain-containing protein [Actinomycetota bacterium]
MTSTGAEAESTEGGIPGNDDPIGGAPGAAEDVCSIAATLDVIGDRWSLLILRDVFRGGHRFSEIQADLGIAKNLLSDRLSRLVTHGLLERVPYQERPVRYDYRLTQKGADLSPALIALMRWGDRWYADNGAPTVLVHETCGHALEQAVRCPDCDEIVSPGQIRSRPGPGRRTS